MVLGWRKDDAPRGGGNVRLEQKQQRGVLFIIPAPDTAYLLGDSGCNVGGS